MRVTSGQIVELASSLEWVDVGRKEDFREAARCLLVRRREDLARFDEAFDAFWRVWTDRTVHGPEALERLLQAQPRSSEERKPPERTAPAGNRSDRAGLRPVPDAKASEGEDEAEGEPVVLAVYSPQEILRHKDFALFNEEELSDARRFLADLRWNLVRRRSRRSRPNRRGRRLDVRRSIRRSVRYGGEMVDLARRGPKLKRRQLVLICDISGSMERYTRLLLHFLYSVEASVQQAEVFVFGTRLTRITRQLRDRNPDAALRAVGGQVQDWSGGTRIGDSLRTFNREWARRVLGRGAIVIIISDGWDRGDPAVLAAEMERLQRQAYRLIWLNPLLGAAQYRPLTQGIQAALPWVDDFLPVHNLHSLESLASLLNQIQDIRPTRGQMSEVGPADI
jgi:uncharacterized protein with von Willebrand factor type A (vWA) domain